MKININAKKIKSIINAEEANITFDSNQKDDNPSNDKESPIDSNTSPKKLLKFNSQLPLEKLIEGLWNSNNLDEKGIQDLVLIEGQLNDIKGQNQSGAISTEAFNLEVTKIKEALFKLIEPD